MNIRKATISDAAEIMTIYNELMDYEMSLLEGDLKSIQLNWERKKTLENVEAYLLNENMRLFVAVDDDNKILGFITGAHSKGVKHREGRLDIFIRKEYREKGTGTALMDRMFEWFRDEDCISVLVNVYAANERAKEFYKKYGLELLGETYKMKL
jgi:ribosomal protein S18 acetylase RimI-like enzyme